MRLTWRVKKTVSDECPDYKPDPYTGEYPLIHCLVAHYKSVIEDKSLHFETLKEAEDFVSKAPLSCYDFLLDGKAIRDERKRDADRAGRNQESKQNGRIYEKKTRTVYASVTRYTLYEGCSNSQCLNASGTSPVTGYSIACPRRMELGVKVRVDGLDYTCDDRTSVWVQEKFGDTFDIFSGYTEADWREALAFGRQWKKIIIYQ